ncbi:Uncharacterized protein APZ42_000272 [Daphnia magna]|uniref:Uncharacterized protein n=1 Tax=Daphnia magna TaxID=35525 RepID=A0A164JSK0_9CRUS|nr:Uncharacterized protein APZ42_000272 [Daphnia magna]
MAFPPCKKGDTLCKPYGSFCSDACTASTGLVRHSPITISLCKTTGPIAKDFT